MAHDRSRCQVTPTCRGIRPLRPVQVRATDPTGLHLEDQVIWPGFGIGDLFDAERDAGFAENSRFHSQSRIAVKLNDIAIGELVLGTHLLPCKLAAAPEPGKPERLGNILVYQLGNVEYAGALAYGKGSVQIS